MLLKCFCFCNNRRISGLSEKQSQSIIEYRQKKGFISNREELKSIKGIGSITFHNCAGFIRVHPRTCSNVISKDEKVSIFIEWHDFFSIFFCFRWMV